MFCHRVVAVPLALPLLLSVPATAQRVLPTDRPIVFPPHGPELRQAERDAASAAEQGARVPGDHKPGEPWADANRMSPAMNDAVTGGIQQRAIEKVLPR